MTQGTTACPLCGKAEPHYHAPNEDWRNPIAWVCEIAHASQHIGSDPIVWSNWQPSLTWHKPDAPAGSMRNLRPLYAGPFVDDQGVMLAALHAAVNWYTPPNDSGPFPIKQIADAIAQAEGHLITAGKSPE